MTGRIEFAKFLELKSMPRLGFLNCPYLSQDELECLKEQLPHLNINQVKSGNGDYSIYLKIATSHQFYEPEDGIWDVEATQMIL